MKVEEERLSSLTAGEQGLISKKLHSKFRPRGKISFKERLKNMKEIISIWFQDLIMKNDEIIEDFDNEGLVILPMSK